MIEPKQYRNQFPKEPLMLMSRVYRFILPDVRKELDIWKKDACAIPDLELRKQALNSIDSKQFHCQGGAVYAAANLPQRHILIPLIVAFQTISDYLDNLCDRSTSMDEKDFRLLHQSMLDAINPMAELQDYYAFRDEKNDGGYLHRLVLKCQSLIRQLPGYEAAQPYITGLVQLYTDLQVYKHIDPKLREQALLTWWDQHRALTPQLKWNEFAAATGSTLGVFMLFLSATESTLTEHEARRIRDAYFPYVCGLHIMLDYLIDQVEDELGGDLNFCSYYENKETMLSRIAFMVEGARNDVSVLPGSSFHVMIIEGLLALYLSDPKVSEQQDIREASRRLMKRSPLMRLFFYVNSCWIRKRLK